MKDYGKEFEAMNVTAVAIGGELLGADQLDAVASLPTYEEALAKLMSVMNGPITKLTRTINDIPGRVVRVVAAVKDTKQ